jgi:hypothetical protein
MKLSIILILIFLWENSNLSSNKCVTIMALKQNQLQVTPIITQANAFIERVHTKLSMTCSDHLTWKTIMKILKSKKIIHLITSFNQLHVYYAIRSTYHTTLQATPCQLVFCRDMIQNIFQRKLGSDTKTKTGHYQ